MNDNDLNFHDVIASVREPFARVRMVVPVEAVVARGQSIRRRRLRTITGAAVAGAAASVLVILAILPGNHTAPVQLTAWTVITEPNGTVAVTIRDLRDPAGLQRALQAHGVPAIVRFHPNGSLMPSCMTFVPSRLATIERQVFVQPPTGSDGQFLLYINPAAVPKTDIIAIDAVQQNGFSIGLLTQDGQCPPGSKPGGIGIQAGHS
jgi:hypothetical protein